MLKAKIVAQKKYYVYTLAFPDEMGGHVFYVGKGTGNRLLSHEIETRNGGRSRKCQAIRKIWSNSYEVQRNIVFESDVEQDTLIYEWAGINMIWSSSYLTNTLANPYSRELNKAEKERQLREDFRRIREEKIARTYRDRNL